MKTSAKTPKKNEALLAASSLSESQSCTTTAKATGRWTREEHFRFLEALKMFGKEWKKVQQHVGTRSSTQARSHAQKFFVKLEKKNLTMEQFLASVNMQNLRSMIENDSDYGEEADTGAINDKLSQSVHSINCSQSVQSAVKSPKNKYKQPTFQVEQPRSTPAIHGRLSGVNCGINEVEEDLLLQDHIESPNNRNFWSSQQLQAQLDQNNQHSSTAACLMNSESAAQMTHLDKSPAKAISDLGPKTATTAGTVQNAHQDSSISTQGCTQQPKLLRVAHKTPQIKPSAPGLTMMMGMSNTIPDNYSQDDKKNDGFALPLVGRKRKVSEACYANKPVQTGKRQHVSQQQQQTQPQQSAAGAAKRDAGPGVAGTEPQNQLEMKRIKSAQQPYSALLQDNTSNQQSARLAPGASHPLGSQNNAIGEQLQQQAFLQNLQSEFQKQHSQQHQATNSSHQLLPQSTASTFQLPVSMPRAQTTFLRAPCGNMQELAADVTQQQNLMSLTNQYASSGLRNQFEIEYVPMPQPQDFVQLSGTVSQTPRLKASTLTSPILGPFQHEAPIKRSTSVLDQDYNLMGLSRNNVLDEDSYLSDHECTTPLPIYLNKFVDKNDNAFYNMPFQQQSLDEAAFGDQDDMLDGLANPFQALPEAGFSARNRSLTFHYPSNFLTSNEWLQAQDAPKNASNYNNSNLVQRQRQQRLGSFNGDENGDDCDDLSRNANDLV